MNTSPRTLDDERVDLLRTAVTVTAAAELANPPQRIRPGARLALAGVAASVLTLALLLGVGALGGGSSPAAAAVEEDGDRVTISLFDSDAPASEVAAILEEARIDVEIVLYEPGPGGVEAVDTAEALAAAETNPVSTIVAFAMGDDADVLPGAVEDGVVESLSFRSGSDVTVRLVVEP